MKAYFVYSDEGLVGEYDASGDELRTYGWAPQSQWGTDPFFVKIGSQYYWYQNDHQGTPQKMITTSGLVVWSATYDSFGNARIDVATITNNLRFPGQYYDSETGLHYNLNRYYDPATGRYLRTDPYGEGLNLYAYCFNNPLSLIDPHGLCVVDTLGRLLGTGFGEESAMMWAEWYNETGNPLYFLMGCFASLWTPETYIQTAVTLVTAPVVAAQIAAAGARSAFAAARVATKQVVEEVVGLPVPYDPRFAARQMRLDPEHFAKLPHLRQEYVTNVVSLQYKVPGMRGRGMSNEEIARVLHAERRELGVKYKNLTPPDELEKIRVRNLKKYGDELGPTIEWLRARGKTWEEIIESASRPGGRDLGY